MFNALLRDQIFQIFYIGALFFIGLSYIVYQWPINKQTKERVHRFFWIGLTAGVLVNALTENVIYGTLKETLQKNQSKILTAAKSTVLSMKEKMPLEIEVFCEEVKRITVRREDFFSELSVGTIRFEVKSSQGVIKVATRLEEPLSSGQRIKVRCDSPINEKWCYTSSLINSYESPTYLEATNRRITLFFIAYAIPVFIILTAIFASFMGIMGAFIKPKKSLPS